MHGFWVQAWRSQGWFRCNITPVMANLVRLMAEIAYAWMELDLFTKSGAVGWQSREQERLTIKLAATDCFATPWANERW